MNVRSDRVATALVLMPFMNIIAPPPLILLLHERNVEFVKVSLGAMAADDVAVKNTPRPPPESTDEQLMKAQLVIDALHGEPEHSTDA